MCNSFLENGEVATKDDCNDDADDSSKKLCLYLFSLMSVSRQYSQYIYIYIYIYIQYTSIYICSTPSCSGSMFRSESCISSEWQYTGVSKARLPSTSWTAATPHRTLPVVSDFDLPAATILSYHDIVAARSAVGRSPSPVRWPGMCCLTTSETRHSVPTILGRC